MHLNAAGRGGCLKAREGASRVGDPPLNEGHKHHKKARRSVTTRALVGSCHRPPPGPDWPVRWILPVGPAKCGSLIAQSC